MELAVQLFMVKILTSQFLYMQRKSHLQYCFGSIVYALRKVKTILSINLSMVRVDSSLERRDEVRLNLVT